MTGTGLRIGFLGAGRMASALARAWVNAGIVVADSVLASDPSSDARDAFRLPATPDNRSVVAVCDLLVLAVKPQMMAGVCGEVRDEIARCRPLVVSVAAGVTLGRLAADLGSDTRLIRVMPNTPCLVGESASGFTPGPQATAEDIALVQKLLDTVGRAVRVSEPLLDAVTGLSGSGPAFVYLIIEALSDGGVKAGLPRDVATMLAAQTVLGAAKMVLSTERHPGSLKDDVASPAGTTIAGLHELERGGLRGALMNAVEAAARRATELGRRE